MIPSVNQAAQFNFVPLLDNPGLAAGSAGGAKEASAFKSSLSNLSQAGASSTLGIPTLAAGPAGLASTAGLSAGIPALSAAPPVAAQPTVIADPATPTLVAGGAPALGPTATAGTAQPTQPSQLPQAQLAPAAQQGQDGQALQMVAELVKVVVALFNQANGAPQAQAPAPQPAQAPVAQAPVAAAPQPAAGVAGTVQNAGTAQPAVAGSGLNITETNPAEKATLQRSLDQIATTPEGKALLAEAQRRGVTIEVGDPSKAAGAADLVACACPDHQAARDQGTVVNGVTLSRGNSSHVIVRDPNNLKTLVHELVHATSTQDGNSQTEEGIADIIGKRVEARITGGPLENPNVTFNNKIALYPELARSNNIQNTLASIGVNVLG